MEEKFFTEWNIEGKEKPADITFDRADPNGANRPDANDWGTHITQFIDFFSAIQEGRQPMIDLNEGRRPVDLILAIYESSRTGKPVDMKEFTAR